MAEYFFEERIRNTHNSDILHVDHYDPVFHLSWEHEMLDNPFIQESDRFFELLSRDLNFEKVLFTSILLIKSQLMTMMGRNRQSLPVQYIMPLLLPQADFTKSLSIEGVSD